MADFKVQRGEATIAGSASSVTITAGVDYDAPAAASKAFIRVVATVLCGEGQENAAFSGQPHRNSVAITNPGNLLTSVTFARADTPTPAVRVQWEIIEYIGAASGDYEFVVRHVEKLAITSAGLTVDTATVSGVANDADVAVFLTSQRADGTSYSRGELQMMLFTTEWVAASQVARATRGNDDFSRAAGCSVAVVEFTGAGWRVERVEHTYSAAGSTETETLGVAVSALSRAFLHAQLRSTTGGPDDGGALVWLSATDTVSFQLSSGSDLPTGISSVAWLVEDVGSGGTNMAVQRVSGSRADGTGPRETWTETVTAVAALATASVMGECGHTTQGGDSHYLFVGLRMTATDTVALSRGTSESEVFYRFEVVEWPEAGAAGPALSEGASAAATQAAQATAEGAHTEGATAGATQAATVTTEATQAEGASAGATLAADATAEAQATEAATAGDAHAGAITLDGSTTEGASAEATVVGGLLSEDTSTEPAQAAASTTADATAEGAQTEAATATATPTADATAETAATEAATAGATESAEASVDDGTTEAASAAVTVAGGLALSSAQSEGAQAGLTLTAESAAGRATTEAAAASDSHTAEATAGGISEQAASAGDTYTSEQTAQSTATESAQAALLLTGMAEAADSIEGDAVAAATFAGLAVWLSDGAHGASAGATFAAEVVAAPEVFPTDENTVPALLYQTTAGAEHYARTAPAESQQTTATAEHYQRTADAAPYQTTARAERR